MLQRLKKHAQGVLVLYKKNKRKSRKKNSQLKKLTDIPIKVYNY